MPGDVGCRMGTATLTPPERTDSDGVGLGEQGCLQKVSSEKSQLKKGAQKKSARPNRAGLSGSVSFNHLPVPVGIYCPTAYLYIWTTPWLTVKGKGILIFKRKAILLALTAYTYASAQAEWKGEQLDGELHPPQRKTNLLVRCQGSSSDVPWCASLPSPVRISSLVAYELPQAWPARSWIKLPLSFHVF